MNKALTTPVFDYSRVDEDTKSKLIWYEGELLRSRKRVVSELLEHGKILHDVHGMLANYSGGTFNAWLASVGFSPGSAQRAIDVYLGFDQFSKLENLEVSALYVLARDEKAKKKALKLAERGVKVTHGIAKRLIQESSPHSPQINTSHKSVGAAPASVSNDQQPAPSTSDRPSGAPEALQNALEGDWPDEPPGPLPGTERAAAEPESPARRQPPKKLDRAGYYAMWNNAIGPLVRLVDKIADGVGERRDPHHEAIQDKLNEATEEMMAWMRIS